MFDHMYSEFGDGSSLSQEERVVYVNTIHWPAPTSHHGTPQVCHTRD